jgi:hypothetical protein
MKVNRMLVAFFALVGLLAGGAWAVGFGQDARISPPWKMPYRCLVKVALPVGWGSGIMIGPDLCLTCGHCAIDPATNQLIPGLKIKMGYAEHLKLEGAVTDVWWPQPTDFEAGSGKDCAIVRLDRPLGLYYGWIRCKEMSPKELLNQKLEFVGYGDNHAESRPEFAGGASPFLSTGIVRETTPLVFGHDCSGWPGSSGGALLSVGDEPQVLGIFAAAVGPSQDGGFLPSYRLQESGNVGIPAQGWADLYKKIPQKQYQALRRVEVRNSNRLPVAVRMRYKSVWKDQEVIGSPVVIPPSRKEPVINLEDGFNGQEVWMETQSLSRSDSSQPESALDNEKWGASRRYYLGSRGDHVLFVK